MVQNADFFSRFFVTVCLQMDCGDVLSTFQNENCAFSIVVTFTHCSCPFQVLVRGQYDSEKAVHPGHCRDFRLETNAHYDQGLLCGHNHIFTFFHFSSFVLGLCMLFVSLIGCCYLETVEMDQNRSISIVSEFYFLSRHHIRVWHGRIIYSTYLVCWSEMGADLANDKLRYHYRIFVD